MSETIHFSDGEKAICGMKKDGTNSVFDAQAVTCKKCITMLTRKAEQEGDPLIAVRVKNQDLNDGVDYVFTYEGVTYKLINNAVHKLPKSVCEHLKLIAYPYRRYVPDQESGKAMQIAGKYYRFSVMEVAA